MQTAALAILAVSLTCIAAAGIWRAVIYHPGRHAPVMLGEGEDDARSEVSDA